jgi:hypothetical protein
MRLLGIAVAGLIVVQTLGAAPVSINFSNVTGAIVNFDGSNHFQFLNGDGTDCDPTLSGCANNATSRDLAITSISNPGVPGQFASLVTQTGNITGVYSIGAITDVIPGVYQTAPVSGTGKFSIGDGLGTAASDFFTAALNWVNITTVLSGGTININGTVNLTSFNYAGNNTDLQALASSTAGSVVASFQFTSPVSLTTLASTQASTSYSGSLTPVNVPEPPFWSLFVVELGGLLLVGRLMKTCGFLRS